MKSPSHRFEDTVYDTLIAKAEAEARASASKVSATKARLERTAGSPEKAASVIKQTRTIQQSPLVQPQKSRSLGVSLKKSPFQLFLSTHASTFRLTAQTVSAIIVARAWDFWLTTEFWPVALGTAEPGAVQDTSEHARKVHPLHIHLIMWLFSLLIGGVLAILTSRPSMRGPAGRLIAYSSGMFIGWQFIGFTKAMHTTWVRPVVGNGGLWVLLPLADAICVTVLAASVVAAASHLINFSKGGQGHAGALAEANRGMRARSASGTVLAAAAVAAAAKART